MVVPVSLTFDNMGLAADVGRGLATGPDPAEPGLSIGYPAVLSMLARHGVTSTFFIEGWNGVHHPERVAELVHAGHEVAAHGWVHERWSDLNELEERDLLSRTIESLSECGADVKGFRAPGGRRTLRTLDLLSDAGLQYDASLDDDGARVVGGIAVLPFDWAHVDWHWFGAQDPPAPPADFETSLVNGLERAAAVHEPMVVIAHARTSAVDPKRLEVLDEFVSTVSADGRFEFLRMDELSRSVSAGSLL